MADAIQIAFTVACPPEHAFVTWTTDDRDRLMVPLRPHGERFERDDGRA
jgi:hypothetical protein